MKDAALARAGLTVFALLALGVAGYAVVAYSAFAVGAAVHPAMRPGFGAHGPWLPLHVFASALALALAPWQLVARWRQAWPALHRWAGRLYLGAGVGLGGVAGAVLASQAYGGPWARLGFGTLALAWLGTGLRAWLAIRAGDVAAHRRWMRRNLALTAAAITLRLWLPAAVLSGLPFEQAYAAAAWLCWVPNLLVLALPGRARRPAR